jgi:MFS family permease
LLAPLAGRIYDHAPHQNAYPLACDKRLGNRMRYTILERVRLAVGLGLVLAIGAMLRYPGGTALDTATSGYSLSRNFLSDLGMTVAYNGWPNRLGASLFVASLLLLVIGFGSGLAGIIRLLWAHSASRRWARGAAAFGLFACAAFVGVALTPENRVMATHVSFTMWAWRLVPIAAALMALASLHSPVFSQRVALAWSLLALLLAGYAALLAWGPSVASTGGLRTQVIAQKAVTVLLTLALVYVAREADRAQSAVRSRSRAAAFELDAPAG